VVQLLGLQRVGRLGNRDDRRVGRGIPERFHLVMGAGNDVVFVDDHRADRLLMDAKRPLGLFQGLAHVLVIRFRGHSAP